MPLPTSILHQLGFNLAAVKTQRSESAPGHEHGSVASFREPPERSRDLSYACGSGTGASSKSAARFSSLAARSLEESAKAIEAMLGARSIDEAINIQRDLARRAYEDWVTALGKLGSTFVDVSKDAYKPLNSALSNGLLGNIPSNEEPTHH